MRLTVTTLVVPLAALFPGVIPVQATDTFTGSGVVIGGNVSALAGLGDDSRYVQISAPRPRRLQRGAADRPEISNTVIYLYEADFPAAAADLGRPAAHPPMPPSPYRAIASRSYAYHSKPHQTLPTKERLNE